MRKRLGASVVFSILLPVAMAAETTLDAYARANVLNVYTVKARQESTLPLASGDQINNLAAGNKVLTLSGKGLTSVDGIAKLRVVDGGREVAITAVKNLQIFLSSRTKKRLTQSRQVAKTLKGRYV